MSSSVSTFATNQIARFIEWAHGYQKIVHWAAFYFCLTFVLSIILALFLMLPGMNTHPKYLVHDAIQGQAFKPYVYRALVPGIIHGMVQLLPANIQAIQSTAFDKIQGYEAPYFAEYVCLIVILLLLLFANFIALKSLIMTFFHASDLPADWIALFGLAILPVFFAYTNYMYDFATLLLFTLLLILMFKARWRTFLLVYVLACLNKETTILITLIFVLYFWRQKSLTPARFFSLVGLQLLAFSLIRFALTWTFRNNPGVSLEIHLFDHNVVTFSEMATVSNLMALIVLLVLLFYAWEEKPRLLRIGLITLPILIGLCFFSGYIDELRDYYEAYPIMFILALHTMSKVVKLPIVYRSQTS